METLQVSLDTLALILGHREEGDERIEDILRRLAGETSPPLAGWSNSGVHIAEGTALRFSYDGEEFEGTVQDGLLRFDEVSDLSPSRAAMEAVLIRTKRKTSFNGWNYISAEIRTPRGPAWMKLADLRRQAHGDQR